MRQIKFRFWRQPYTTSISETGKPDRTEEIRGQMLYWPDTKFMINYQEKSLDLEAYLKGDTSPMQFTGLTDKNGKEIYEGDIVKVKGFTVKWKNTERGEEPIEQHYEKTVEVKYVWAGFAFPESETEPELEVIGNIYEHSHLLK